MKSKFLPVVNHFFPNASDFELETFGNGHINDTFLLEIKEDAAVQKYVLQHLNTKIFTAPDKIAKNINEVTQFLQNQAYQYQICTPIAAPDASFYHIEKNQYWRVFNYISNSYAPEKCESSTQAFESGKAFGHFFKTLSLLDTSSLEVIIPKFHDASYRWQQFSDSLTNATNARFQKAQTEIAFCVKNIDLINTYLQAIKDLPKRTTHNDTKITNILFDKNTHKPLAIIDLDTLQEGTILSEFGDMVRTFCNAAAEDEKMESKIIFTEPIYEGLKKGFLSETAEILTKLELDLLPFAAKLTIFVQALRFLTDYLNNDIYYKVKFANHNLIRAKNQICLLKQLLENRVFNGI